MCLAVILCVYSPCGTTMFSSKSADYLDKSHSSEFSSANPLIFWNSSMFCGDFEDCWTKIRKKSCLRCTLCHFKSSEEHFQMPSVILNTNEVKWLQLNSNSSTAAPYPIDTQVNWIVPPVNQQHTVCCQAKPIVLALLVVMINYTALFCLWMISEDVTCIMIQFACITYSSDCAFSHI